MGTEQFALMGIAIFGIGTGAFAAFSYNLSASCRTLLALLGLVALIAAVSAM
jgi:hypothetical protein